MKNLLQNVFITANILTTTKDISYIMRGDDDNYYVFLDIYNFNAQDKMTLDLLKKEAVHHDILLLEVKDKEKEISDFSNDMYGLSDLIKEKNKKINLDSASKDRKFYLILKDNCEQKIKKEFLNILVIIQKYQSKCLDCEDALMFIPFEEKVNNNEIRKDIGSNKGCRFVEKSGQPFYFESCSEAQPSWINALIYQSPYQKMQSKLLMNALNLSFFSSSSENTGKIPYMAIISADQSADGFIDTLRYGIKGKIKEGEIFSCKYNIGNKSDNFINPLDVRFGQDKPLGGEFSVIIETLSYIIGHDLDMMVLWTVIDNLYKPKFVKMESIPEIKKVILEEGVSHDEMSWFEIRNVIARSGKNEPLAWYAHKQAMPTLNDFRNALVNEVNENREVFEKQIQAAILNLDEALKNNVFATGPTNINIDYKEHITHIKLPKDTKEKDFCYIVAASHLYKQFLIDAYDDVSEINEYCKPILSRYINKMKNVAKRVVLDDVNIAPKKDDSERTLKNIATVFAREARKYKVDLTVLLDKESYENHNLDNFKQFISAAFLLPYHDYENNLGASSFISGKGIEFNSEFATKFGEIHPVLYFNLSPVEYWAITTIRAEISLRDKLYTMTSTENARKILADVYPEGLLMAQCNEDYNEAEALENLLKLA